MKGPPARYFPGRAPVVQGFHSDDSDNDDDAESAAEVQELTTRPDEPIPQPTARRRITARVVKPGTDEVAGSHSAVRGTKSSFIPVSGSFAALATEMPASASESASSSSSDSSAVNDEGSGSAPFGASCSPDDDVAHEDGKEFAKPTLRPVFVRPDLKAAEQKRLDKDRRLQDEEEGRMNVRRMEARRLLDQALQEEQRQRDNARGREVLPDDADRAEDADADHALWKVREILRIRRDREEMRAWQNRSSDPSSVFMGDVDT